MIMENKVCKKNGFEGVSNGKWNAIEKYMPYMLVKIEQEWRYNSWGIISMIRIRNVEIAMNSKINVIYGTLIQESIR